MDKMGNYVSKQSIFLTFEALITWDSTSSWSKNLYPLFDETLVAMISL